MTLVIILIVLAIAGASYWALTRKDAMEFTDNYWDAHEARKTRKPRNDKHHMIYQKSGWVVVNHTTGRKVRSDKGQKRAP